VAARTSLQFRRRLQQRGAPLFWHSLSSEAAAALTQQLLWRSNSVDPTPPAIEMSDAANPEHQ
jgi:hypothetical protein